MIKVELGDVEVGGHPVVLMVNLTCALLAVRKRLVKCEGEERAEKLMKAAIQEYENNKNNADVFGKQMNETSGAGALEQLLGFVFGKGDVK